MQKYAKAIVAIVGVVLAAVAEQYTGVQWMPVLIAAVAAFGVYMVPNLPE